MMRGDVASAVAAWPGVWWHLRLGQDDGQDPERATKEGWGEIAQPVGAGRPATGPCTEEAPNAPVAQRISVGAFPGFVYRGQRCR